MYRIVYLPEIRTMRWLMVVISKEHFILCHNGPGMVSKCQFVVNTDQPDPRHLVFGMSTGVC